MLHQYVGLDATQVEALAARQHRDRHFADLGGGEDEFGVFRRLFQRLQEGVERRGRQHVHFVDDVDLVARAGRRITDAVVDLTHVIDAGMGRGIHFQHIHVPAFHDRLTLQPGYRHMDGRALHRPVRQFVVQRPGENSRRRGFTDPAHAGQNPGLRNPAGFERVGNSPDHGVLADQVLEAGRTVLPRQYAIRLARLKAAAGIGAILMGATGIVGRHIGGRLGWGASVSHRSIDPQLSVSRSRLAEQW